jgi:ADP-ribosyl-[dinitrogen reductase] hydrolase
MALRSCFGQRLNRTCRIRFRRSEIPGFALTARMAATCNAIDRYRGCLLGLAVGDALGTTLEFKAPGSFKPIEDMVGGGPFRLQPGQWTDDTSMALCLAESLLCHDGFNAQDQMERYVRWWKEGHWSSTGKCFDIGGTVARALDSFISTRNPYAGPAEAESAGNGSLMRLAPVPMFYRARLIQAIERSGESSRMTHGAVEAVDACRYFGGLLANALNGMNKEALLGAVPEYWKSRWLAPAVARIAEGSFRVRNPPEIRGTGYVIDCLEAALWAFYHSTNFREGALLAVNLGHDADTTGAVYGQIAGAVYGQSGIPGEWLEKLWLGDEMGALAERLHTCSVRP